MAKSILKFWREGCVPCKALGPVVAALCGEYGVELGDVNVGEQLHLASHYGVMSVPVLIFFEDGRETGRLVGYANRTQILGKLGVTTQ